MGVDYFVLNLEKRQYLDPAKLGDRINVGYWLSGLLPAAIGILVCKPVGSGSGLPLEGSWER